MPFTSATRKTVPMLISLAGTSGSGKTLSGLLLAAGIAGPQGRVGFIDAENGRGRLYADDPLVRAALPHGYEIDEITAPFTPARYKEKVVEAEKADIAVCLIDSFSHEWEGIGGCTDIAEQNKLRGMPNWALAKRAHKLLVYHLLSSQMHLVFCLRAREKVKILEVGGKTEVVPVGIQPIAEKNFVFEMLLSLLLDEKTHCASPIKVPRMIADIFPGGRMLTKEDGDRVRIWNETGAAADPHEQIQKRARAAAEEGLKAYQKFFASVSAAQRKVLAATSHEENKKIAEQADQDTAAVGEQEPDTGNGGGSHLTPDERMDLSSWLADNKPKEEQIHAALRIAGATNCDTLTPEQLCTFYEAMRRSDAT